MSTCCTLKPGISLGALISIIDRTHLIYMNENLRRFNLSAGQFPIFMYLLHHPKVMQESLARIFYLDKSTVARIIKKLEDDGYVSRSVDTDNRRAYQLVLTQKGLEIVPEIIAIDKEWERMILSCFQEKEHEQFISTLTQVTQMSLECLHHQEDT